jgi:DNA-binding NarL/FixJ family response regulator
VFVAKNKKAFEASARRGMSNKQIAERLVITPKTAGNHVEHIYAKIDASNRAAAALFAVQHGLLPEERTAATSAF